MRVVAVGRKRRRWWRWRLGPSRGGRQRSLKALLLPGLIAAVLAIAAHLLLTHPWGLRDAANVLVLGVDEAQEGRARSDTLMLARVQVRPQRQVIIVSLPRDTRVEVPGHGYHKLNAAYSFGGPALARATVQAALGVPVDRLVVINSAGLAELVDALGGVKVNVSDRMDYDDNAQDLHIHLKPGEQRLYGQQAVGFVRFRSDRQGDLGRVERQQAFVKALVQQSVTMGAWRQMGAVRRALKRAIQTDLTLRQMAGLAYTMRWIDRCKTYATILPGRPRYIHGVSYYLADLSAVAEMFAAGTCPESSALAGVTPRTQLAVLNGCGRNGYARRAARQLQAAGLAVVEVANAPQGSYPHTLIFRRDEQDSETVSEQVRRALRHGRVVVGARDRPDGLLEVVIGEDFRPAPGF